MNIGTVSVHLGDEDTGSVVGDNEHAPLLMFGTLVIGGSRDAAEHFAASAVAWAQEFTPEARIDSECRAADTLDELVAAIDDCEPVLHLLNHAKPSDRALHAIRHALMRARDVLGDDDGSATWRLMRDVAALGFILLATYALVFVAGTVMLP